MLTKLRGLVALTLLAACAGACVWQNDEHARLLCAAADPLSVRLWADVAVALAQRNVSLVDALAITAPLSAAPLVSEVLRRMETRQPRVMAALRAMMPGKDGAIGMMALMQALHGLHCSDPDKLPETRILAVDVEIATGTASVVLPLGFVSSSAHVGVLAFDELDALRAALDATSGRAPKASARTPVQQYGASRCNTTAQRVECSRLSYNILTVVEYREVLYQTPLGTAPSNGWPAVIHFQGTGLAPHLYSWEANLGDSYGRYYQTLTISSLLDNGFVVITPEALGDGETFWQTNIAPYNLYWSLSDDAVLMASIMRELSNANGRFGRINQKRIYATGFSSGGYMTSRMATDLRGQFKALAVHSGSYATCIGALCAVPLLPVDHPPTLFLHGARDVTVPVSTMQLYANQMNRQQLEYDEFIDPNVAHEYFVQSPSLALRWFTSHP